ncbi:MAG: FAD-dependent oxidoreductase [Acidimicrobiales bacterium]
MAETGGDAAFPTLTDEQIDRIRAFGDEVAVETGTLLFVEGQRSYDFIVILSGAVAIVGRNLERSSEVRIARHTPGRFLGELSLLTGERTTLAARADEDGTVVLRITPDRFRELMSTEPEVADIVFTAFVARREVLRRGAGATVIRIIGSRFSARAVELESFARRQRLAHQWIDLDDPSVDDIEVLLASVGVTTRDTPVVVTPTAVLRHPTVGQLAEHLGVAFRPSPGRVRDLVVVGAGPAGLAAGVYGASEGLDTLVVDGHGVGGQAGASSRIENYFGFPNGLSGSDLVESGALQAQRLGATINAPCRVSAIRVEADHFVLDIGEGEVATRAVILATGVSYRKLEVPDLARYENAGVFYAATDLEARVCGGSHVVVVGGGNSAGQAAVFLAQRGSTVSIVLRRDNLAETMSKYLIDRIMANPQISVLPYTQVTALHGEASLTAVDLTTVAADGSRSTRTVEATGVFSFIGASADTGWLGGLVVVDDDGFVLTDHDLPPASHAALAFETSQPGIFAVGDVRHGSMKRVAAAVGEGSSAVRSVHQRLAPT